MSPTVRGILLAILATLIWSGNFIVARAIADTVSPITLGFVRWATACLFIIPLGWSSFRRELDVVKRNWLIVVVAAFFGISVFNTLVYLAGHHSSALNLALIGTTSSPIFSFILAAIFLREKIPLLRIVGLACCIAGILLIIAAGSLQKLYQFQFTAGDVWILLAAFSFAVYNVVTRRKPVALSANTWLFATFVVGTLLMLPLFVYDNAGGLRIPFTASFALIALYLGLGNSVIAYYCWNSAIQSLGAARASIFGNLIPVFSSIEAVWLLHEQIQTHHWWGMMAILIGLILANAVVLKSRKRSTPKMETAP